MPEKVKKSTWINLKSVLINQDKSELLNLIKDLYSLNKNNKCFKELTSHTQWDHLQPQEMLSNLFSLLILCVIP